MALHVLKRTDPKGTWLHFLIIRDAEVTVLELIPAPWGGWHLRSVIHQQGDDWAGYSADSILAYKRANPDSCDHDITAEEASRALDLETRAPAILASRRS